MSLQETLLQKAKSKGLAHFYIVEGPDLLNFTQKFIQNYYAQIENHQFRSTNLMDYPDVFVLGAQNNDEEEKAFTVQDAENFSRFFEFKPVQGQRKFAVITEGHRINTIVANKWLKLLEEPQGESTIFLLNPRGVKLLDTIHSRAIHLRLPPLKTTVNQDEWKEFLAQVKNMNLVQFLETYSRGDKKLEDYLNELLHWEAEQTDQLNAKSALETWLKSYQEMETFHQPTATKWTLFYSYLSKNVLPRASH